MAAVFQPSQKSCSQIRKSHSVAWAAFYWHKVRNTANPHLEGKEQAASLWEQPREAQDQSWAFVWLFRCHFRCPQPPAQCQCSSPSLVPTCSLLPGQPLGGSRCWFKYSGPCHPGGLGLSFQLVASAWRSPGCVRHLLQELTDGNVFSFSVSLLSSLFL